MKLLASLCVCHGVAMRDKQELIYKHLLDCSEILVQTSLHSTIYWYVNCMGMYGHTHTLS